MTSGGPAPLLNTRMIFADPNLIFSGEVTTLGFIHLPLIFAAQAAPGLFGFDLFTIGVAILVLAAGALVIILRRRKASIAELAAAKSAANLRTRANERRNLPERRNLGRRTEVDRRGSETNGGTVGRQQEEAAKQASIEDLPVVLFNGLAALPKLEPLPFSDDESLMAAIDEANHEIEPDDEIRAMAIKVLVMFRNGNAVEAMSRLVRNDPSPQIRAKAVAALAEYDHESVFPPIVLASADATREVRAAAAKALFTLSFDRAHCWARLAEMYDDPLSLQLAKAAIEGGLAARSLDRLAHTDLRAAYEAFALMVLLIRSGEIAPIIEAIRQGRDNRIKLALLHVVSVEKNAECIAEVKALADKTIFPSEIRERISSL